MLNSPAGLLDATRILFDLQQANEIAQSFSGSLQPQDIAKCVTDGLVDRFGCAFARIWLLEADQPMLKLVASSGMYTNTDGFFGRVPMGAYKVGKIAQNRVAFLSSNLAAEPWVGNREWAIANNIQGFAGYPLAIKDRVLGVLATFSNQPLEPEFLEVLQTLCTIVTIAFDTALQYQKHQQTWQASSRSPAFNQLPLSEQLVAVLSTTRLTLFGTEKPLTLASTYVFLKAAEVLATVKSTYCRLIYAEESVVLEAIVPATSLNADLTEGWLDNSLSGLSLIASSLGGTVQTQPSQDQRVIQLILTVPYSVSSQGVRLRIRCRSTVLQLAFTHLATLAGLTVCHQAHEWVPLLTDDPTQAGSASVLWVQQEGQAPPKGIRARLSLSISPEQLHQAVTAVVKGETWGLEPSVQSVLSDRELEILSLLTQGHRDRDVADCLVISESTVKFHINNVLAKLKARTRYQAIYQAIVNGWI